MSNPYIGLQNDLVYALDKLVTGPGSLGIGVVKDEGKVRFVITGAGASNVVRVRGRINNQTTWNTLAEFTGNVNELVEVFTYDELEVFCVVFEASNGYDFKLVASSFDSNKLTIETPSGTIDNFNTLTFESSDNSIDIVADPLTGTIDFTTGASTGVTSVNGRTGDVILDKTDVGLDQVDNTSDADKPISNDTQDALDLKIDIAEKGVADGVAPLNSSTKIDSIYLPSYVDDVVEVADYAALPIPGEDGKIYVTLDTNKIYRWSGSLYIEIAENKAVWGSITGTLSSQTDLQNALNDKVAKAGDTMTGPLNMSALSENIQFSVYGLNATQGIEIKSDDDATRPTGNVTISTGDASNSDAAGSIYLQGGSNVDGNPGNILLTAGQSSGTGSDGVIVLDAKGVVYLNQNPSGYIDAVNHQIINVADPISSQDAATKNWVEQASAQTNVLYVDSTASLFGADGSLFRPFVTIADALAAASDGYVIEILPGTYNETQVIIPSTLYSLTIKGKSQGSVLVTNGFSYTSPASNIDLLLQELNVGQLSLDASAALNGIVTLKQTSVTLDRSDTNGNVFLTISESTIFGGTCYGAGNISECLIIGNIDIYSYLFIFENCKFVSSVTAYGTALVRVLDSNLFGATEFLNGVTVGLDVPILQIDTASDYFGSFTGTATKILLANIPVDKLTQSGATTNQAIVWDGTKWNPAFLVSNDPIDNNSPDIAPSQQAVLTKLNEYLRLQDGGTITGPVEIQNNKPNYFSPILALTSAGGSSNIFTITRNRSLGDSDSSNFTGVDLAYNSSESSNNGTLYFINANSGLPQVNDLVLFESTNNIQNVEGYICTTEVYYYISNVTSGIWDFYNRYTIDNHTGTLNGYDFQATVNTMTSGSISGVNFTVNIADKGAGDVDIFETNSNINFTSTGDDFNGVKITPIISGTPENVTGVFVDMSNSTGVNVKAISVIGDSDFSGQINVKDSPIVVDYTITQGFQTITELNTNSILLLTNNGTDSKELNQSSSTSTLNRTNIASTTSDANMVLSVEDGAPYLLAQTTDYANDTFSQTTLSSQSFGIDFTDNTTGVNSIAIFGSGAYTIQTTQPDSSYVLIEGTSTGTAATQYDGVNTTPLMPTLPEHYTVKEYVDNLVSGGETGIVERFEVMKEPTGFINRTSSTTSFNDLTREFTIAPTGASYDVYVQGDKFTKSASETITLDNLSGNHYIYFDSLGNLASTQIINSDLFQNNALISVIYWNSDTSSHTYFAEERHGLTMDGATHSYLHTVFGARYLSGLALQNFVVDGDGSLATHAQFTSDSGSIRDEDLLITLSAQTQIPVLYRQGQLWRKKAADSFPVIYSGTAGYTGASGRLPFNEFTGGAWQLTEIANNGFVLVHVFGTNDKETPVVAIQGIATYGNVTAARLAASSEITSLSGLPFAEFVALGSVVFESANAYTNTPKAIIRSVNGGNYVDFRGTQLYTPAGEPSTHSLLSNLSSDDHLQYHTDARGDARYNLKSPGDISETSFSISNNEPLATNVTGLSFDFVTVSSFTAIVSVQIDAISNISEVFELIGINNSGTFSMSVTSVGDDSGVIFSITPSGQIQYTSANYIGFVSGTIKFRAITTSI